MISLFIIESELQLIIISSLLKKNDIIIDLSLGIDQDYINSILKSKIVNYYIYSKVSRRNYLHILFFLKMIVTKKSYEVYTYSDECLHFRCLNIISKPIRINLIENGEKTFIGDKKKRPFRFHLGNTFDFLITIIAGKKINISYASNNISTIVGFFSTNAYGIPQKKINVNLCIWPKGRTIESGNIICIGLLKFSKNKEQIIKKINAYLAINTKNVYIKFHQRESQEVINEFKGNYSLIERNHSLESYFWSSKYINVVLNKKNSVYYYAKLFGFNAKLIDE